MTCSLSVFEMIGILVTLNGWLFLITHLLALIQPPKHTLKFDVSEEKRLASCFVDKLTAAISVVEDAGAAIWMVSPNFPKWV